MTFTDIIAGFFSSIATAIISLLPVTPSIPVEVTDAMAYLVGVATAFDDIFPVVTLLYAFGIVLAFEAVMLLWRTVRYILNLIRGSNA